jgi:hypothetical protein
MSEALNIPEGGLDLNSAAALMLDRADGNRENEATEEEPRNESEALAEGEVFEDESAETEIDDAELLDEEESYEEDDEVERISLKVDGEEVEVDLDELKKGYSRQASYTKKSQELASQRKEFEAHQQAILQERATYADLLGKLQNHLLIEEQGVEPNWDALFEENPVQASKQKYLYEKQSKARKDQLGRIASEQNRLSQELQAEQTRVLQALIVEEKGKVRDLIPEWSDEKSFERGSSELREWLIDFGLEEAEINSLVKAKHVELAEMARRYATGKARTKAQPKQKRTVKAGSAGRSTRKRSQTKIAQAQGQRLQKTGRLQDAVELAKLLDL